MELELPLDGATGATSFPNLGSVGGSYVASGTGVSADTTVFLFGGASAQFTGSGHLSGSGVSSGTGDFTLSAWVFPTQLITSYATIASQQGTVGLFLHNGAPIWYFSSDYCVGPQLSLNAWHHLAVVRSSGTIRLFVDGVATSTTATSSLDVALTSIGGHGSEYFVGNIDEVSLVVGAALYTSDFVPTKATNERLNPASKAASIALSLEDKKYTGSGSVRSKTSKSSGKWYWEVKILANSVDQFIGLSNASSNLGSFPGSDSSGIGYGPNGYIYYAGGGSTRPASAVGDIIGIAYDADALTLQFYKNGVALGGPATSLPTGPLFATLGAGVSASASINFGVTPFAYTPPSGYVRYDNSNPTVTFDPTGAGSGITLTNNNLTATSSGVASVRVTTAKTDGKWYWEVAVGSNGNGNVIGVQARSSNLDSYTGASALSWGYYSGGGVFREGGLNGTQAAYAPNDRIGCALDMDNKKLQFYRNGTLTGDLIPLGAAIELYASVGAGSSSVSNTINLGGTAFSYAPPSGFLAYQQASTGPVAEPIAFSISMGGLVYGFSTQNLGITGFELVAPTFNFVETRDAGLGRIFGTTKEKPSDAAPSTPVRKKVRLIRDRDGALSRETMSHTGTGEYEFLNLNMAEKYTVVAYDENHTYRAVIADNLSPEPM